MRKPSRPSIQLGTDWRDFVRALTSHKVRFLIVGAHALAAHGRPRYTGDFDVLVSSTVRNAERLAEALNDFGLGEPDDASWFSETGNGRRYGIPPNGIDVLTVISGVSFAEAWKSRVKASFAGRSVHVLGRRAFIKNKRSAGRPKDLADLALLEETQPKIRKTARPLSYYPPRKR